MRRRALIVEDEILVALDLECALVDMGIEVVAIATDRRTALAFADRVDIALVDINLRDGQTGPSIGHILATEHGVSVIFVTANPALLGDGIEGTMGVMTKPLSDAGISATIGYLTARAAGGEAAPPMGLRVFN